MNHARRWYIAFGVEDIELLHILVMAHVASRLESREIEPWEARLLAKLAKASNRDRQSALAGAKGHRW